MKFPTKVVRNKDCISLPCDFDEASHNLVLFKNLLLLTDSLFNSLLSYALR